MNICKIRVKNEAHWIKFALESVLKVFDHVIVLDDFSTDRTADVCKSFENVTLISSPFDSMCSNGLRDQNYLLQKALRYKPKWILTLDGDEVLPDTTTTELKRIMALDNFEYNTILFKILYFWNAENILRVDGIYDRLFIPRMFRATDIILQNVKTEDFVNTAGLHASTLPTTGFTRKDYNPIPALDLNHYGYLTQQQRLKKYAYYTKVDPNNEFEDNYRHMVIGDTLPAETIAKHAGPLKLVEVN